MSKRSGEKRDFMQVARQVVEKAIGEHFDGTPLPLPPSGKKLAGSIGGKKGGQSRAKKLSAEERVKIARNAARARWKSKSGQAQ